MLSYSIVSILCYLSVKTKWLQYCVPSIATIQTLYMTRSSRVQLLKSIRLSAENTARLGSYTNKDSKLYDHFNVLYHCMSISFLLRYQAQNFSACLSIAVSHWFLPLIFVVIPRPTSFKPAILLNQVCSLYNPHCGWVMPLPHYYTVLE